MPAPPLHPQSAAAVLARMLRLRGVDRVFGLCGGHVMPIWMRLDAEAIAIVDVRDERAAVYMAHAYAELSGRPGVALVTAGPGVTNAMTGIANAHVARAPVLVLSGTAPQPQQHRGALQDLDHPAMLRGITRYARTLRDPAQLPQALDEALAAACGHAGGEPGPAFIDFPTDTLRAPVPQPLQLAEHLQPRTPARIVPDPQAIELAVASIAGARRRLVIGGRGARNAAVELARLLEVTGAAFLDTGECKGVLPEDHPAGVSAMRSVAMADADLVITVGRKLDFQLGYGSPAVFRNARWLRIGDHAAELRDNRRGEVELLANPALALQALAAGCAGRVDRGDTAWRERLRGEHLLRARRARQAMAEAPDGGDGFMHPNRLLHEVQQAIGEEAVVVADGGDFLSFARVGIRCAGYLDPGSLGCLGVGTAFGIGAALAAPARLVAVLSGDGAFGFNCMEIDTAVRHRVPLLVVVANNGAWQIEVHDQQSSHGRVVATRLQRADYAALARGLGAHAERVERAEDLPPALARALAALAQRRPALLDVQVSADALSSDARSGLAWVPDLQPLQAWDTAERDWRCAVPSDASGR